MINLKIKTNGTVRNLTLPYPGQSIPDIIEKNSVVTVSEVTEPESLKYMEGHEWNIDEINFLAKRMESFDKREKRQFDAIASQLKPSTGTGPHQSDFQSIEVYPNLRLQQSYRDRQDTCHQQKTGNEFCGNGINRLCQNRQRPHRVRQRHPNCIRCDVY